MINKNKYSSITFSSILLIFTFMKCVSAYDINFLARQYAPQIRFHPQEKYFPIEMNEYISQCALQKRDLTDPAKPIITLEKYPLTPKDIIQKSYIPINYNDFLVSNNKMMTLEELQSFEYALFKMFDQVNAYFISPTHCYKNAKNDNKIIDNVHKGKIPNNQNRVYAPCYYHVCERPYKKGHIIQYILMYAYQGSLLPENMLTNILPYISDIGIHEADVEHIDVYVDVNGKLEWVYFSAHGSDPFGEMLPASKISFVNTTHPIAYAAKYGHALHSKVTGRNGIDAPVLIGSTLGSFLNPWSITQRLKLASDTFSSIWNTMTLQGKQDIDYTFDTTAQKGPQLDCQDWLVDLGTRQHPTPGQEWILFAGRLGATYDRVNGSIIEHAKERNFIFNNSPASPAVDNAWWRTSINTLLLTELKNIKQGDVLDFSKIIPTRMRKIACIIKNIKGTIKQVTLSSLIASKGEHTVSQENPYISALETFTYKTKVEVRRCVDKNNNFSNALFDLQVWGFEE